MDKTYTDDIESIATFNHDSIDRDESTEVNLRDLLYVYCALQELQRFWHQPLHHRRHEDIERFMGTLGDKGGLKLIHTSIHKKMRDMFPEFVDQMFGDGAFESPDLPFYYEPKSST